VKAVNGVVRNAERPRYNLGTIKELRARSVSQPREAIRAVERVKLGAPPVRQAGNPMPRFVNEPGGGGAKPPITLAPRQ
jgi:hypothetical protein